MNLEYRVLGMHLLDRHQDRRYKCRINLLQRGCHIQAQYPIIELQALVLKKTTGEKYREVSSYNTLEKIFFLLF